MIPPQQAPFSGTHYGWAGATGRSASRLSSNNLHIHCQYGAWAKQSNIQVGVGVHLPGTPLPQRTVCAVCAAGTDKPSLGKGHEYYLGGILRGIELHGAGRGGGEKTHIPNTHLLLLRGVHGAPAVRTLHLQASVYSACRKGRETFGDRVGGQSAKQQLCKEGEPCDCAGASWEESLCIYYGTCWITLHLQSEHQGTNCDKEELPDRQRSCQSTTS